MDCNLGFRRLLSIKSRLILTAIMQSYVEEDMPKECIESVHHLRHHEWHNIRPKYNEIDI